jgi:hypothetical protein
MLRENLSARSDMTASSSQVLFNITSINSSHSPTGIVSFFYQNAGLARLEPGLSVLGQVFAPGELPANTRLAASIGGVTVAVQADIKTRHADGSANMVVLTVERPALAAGASLQVDLARGQAAAPPPLDLGAGLAGHHLDVTLTGPGGAAQHFDVLAALQHALAAGTASVWQSGPLASQARVAMDLNGAARLVFDVTLFRGGGLSVEAQFNNDGAMEALGGRVVRQLALTLDGVAAPVVRLDQGQYQNWHGSFSTTVRDGGQGLGDAAAGWLNIRQDVAHLAATGAVARYDLTHGVDTALLDSFAAATAATGWDAPLSNRGVATFMPGTGGRADIGFTTASNTAWLMTQDARAANHALGQAEAASTAPWHLWDAKHGTWLGTDAYPALWTDARGGVGRPGQAASPGLTQQPDGATGWTLDAAHQPDLSFVPYVMTGSRWMLDNLQAQASWSLMSQWPAMRGQAQDLVVQDNQVRGAAWSLRQIDEAAWASPIGSAEKAAFTEASAANWAWLVSKIPEWTARQGEAHGWLPGDYGVPGALPPWQQDYFASTAIAAARRGNADALTFLNWEANFLVGRFTHAKDGMPAHDGAAYLLAIADPTTGTPYGSWAAIGAQTAALGWSNGTGWSQSQGDYPQLALATLAGIAELTGSQAAAQAYRNLLADAPPFTTTSDYTRDPTYSLVAPALPSTAALAVVLSADSWRGDPEAMVLLDGREIFHGPIAASQASGGIAIELGPVTLADAHAVTIRFLNDAWGGTAATDRNLHVEDLRLGPLSTGQHADLFATGEVTLHLPGTAPPPAPVVVAPPATPPAAPPGVRIQLGLSEDAWVGDAHATILLDGVVLLANQAVTASHAAGKVQQFVLHAAMAPGAHTLTVRFLDDAWGGNAAADRNLYVDSVVIGGVDLHQSAALLWSRDASFAFTQGAAPGIGSGPDTLRLGLSADSWEGHPHFLVLVDGRQVGGVQSASASHKAGQHEFLDIHGAFGTGPHKLTLRFLDDAWGGTTAQDRNLHLDSLALNGVDLHQHAALFSAGDAVFAF